MTLSPDQMRYFYLAVGVALLARSAWLIWRTGALIDRGTAVTGEVIGWDRRVLDTRVYWHARVRYAAGGTVHEFVSQRGEAQAGALGPIQVTVDRDVPGRAEIIGPSRPYVSALVGVVLGAVALVQAFR